MRRFWQVNMISISNLEWLECQSTSRNNSFFFASFSGMQTTAMNWSNFSMKWTQFRSLDRYQIFVSFSFNFLEVSLLQLTWTICRRFFAPVRFTVYYYGSLLFNFSCFFFFLSSFLLFTVDNGHRVPYLIFIYFYMWFYLRYKCTGKYSLDWIFRSLVFLLRLFDLIRFDH